MSLEAKLQQLRARFAGRVPGRIAEMQQLRMRLVDAPDDSVAAEELERKAHTLAGTAGSHGFTALGEQTQQLELLIEAARGEGAALSEDVLLQAGALLAGMSAQCEGDTGS